MNTDKEKLIEEARDAMIAHYLSSPGYEWNWHEMASIALAVFEKAHTPTDDERELSERLVARHLPLSASSDTAANIVRHLTEVGLLRRSEVPEPVTPPRAGSRPGTTTTDATPHPDPAGGESSEPQGEPSDAQVLAAAIALIGGSAILFAEIDTEAQERYLDDARAALRAASAVTAHEVKNR